MLRPYTRPDPPQFDDVRTDLNAELFQQDLAYRAAGDSRHRFAGARSLQDVARVPAVVLERAREIGVAGAGPGHLTPSLRDGQPRGDPLEDPDEAAPVRLTGGREPEGHSRR